jgi:hypothetical protein
MAATYEVVNKKDFIKRHGNDPRYRGVVKNELAVEPADRVIIIRGTDLKAYRKQLQDAGYNTHPIMHDPRGEQLSAMRGAGEERFSYRIFRPLIEAVAKYLPGKAKEEIAGMFGRAALTTEKREHLKFWQIGSDIVGTAHTDVWHKSSRETVGAHPVYRGQESYSGKGNYQEGTDIALRDLEKRLSIKKKD